ncbi:hypothetical protein JXJ21_07290 [candidate division KSB1 bacterium]|nr:hypothetical protein [candidate division KSB1 bacterium]
MGKLIYTFASLAYTVNAKWGKGVARKGIERLAKIVHKYHIPITWLTDANVGKIMYSQFNEWHEAFGDDVAVYWENSISMPGSSKGGSEERKALRELFPWSEAALAASGARSNAIHAEVKAAGMQGLWGSCWEQIEIDGITDRGAPWGFFYCADDCFKLPSRAPGGIISVEWTARDLCKSLHSNAPTVYSSDPDDVGRTGLCTGDDVEYWKGMFDNYIRNIAHNDFVFFSQHQESHEMEYGEVCREYSPSDIDRSEKMLDNFLAYVKSFGDDVQFCTIQEAMDIYRNHSNMTVPSIMLAEDVPCRKPPFWYAKGWATGPFPKTLLYYDIDCQMAFIEDKFEPVLLRDYIHNRVENDPTYFKILQPPRIFCDTPWQVTEFTELPFRIPCSRELPYGLALWYDFTRFKIVRVDGADAVGPVENQVVLLRKNLTSGENEIFVQLEKFE